METEHRSSIRRQQRLPVVINYAATYSKIGRVVDISPDGAFVEMGADSGLPDGAQVEAILRFRYKRRPVQHRLPAEVVRVSGQGVALRFGRYADSAYTDLVNLLYTSGPNVHPF